MDNMENNMYQQELPRERGFAGVSLGQYTARTFFMMFLGLLVTFAVAIFFSKTNMGLTLLMYAFTYIPAIAIVLLVVQLGVVLAMSFLVRKLSPTAAGVCFFVYAVITGLTFTVYFLMYDLTSLVLVFAATALYFAGMAVFGYVTNIDLSRIRTVLIGGLVFVILLNVLMLFIPGLAVMDRVLCTFGVVLFLVFTAYDTQKIRSFYYTFQGDEAMLKKASVISALELYLDFINLFLRLLQIFGKKKD